MKKWIIGIAFLTVGFVSPAFAASRVWISEFGVLGATNSGGVPAQIATLPSLADQPALDISVSVQSSSTFTSQTRYIQIIGTPTPHTNAGNTAVYSAGDYTQRQAYDALVRANNGVGHGFIDNATAFAGGSISVNGLWDTTGGKGTLADGLGIHPLGPTVTAIVAANVGNLPTLLSVAQYK